MPRPDAAKHLADRLDKLHHPSGKVIRQMVFATTGMAPETKAKIQSHALLCTEAAIHELERAGYTVSHKDDPKPADAEGYKIARIKCVRCGKELLRIGVDESMIATMGMLALRSIAQINPQCPHE